MVLSRVLPVDSVVVTKGRAFQASRSAKQSHGSEFKSLMNALVVNVSYALESY